MSPLHHFWIPRKKIYRAQYPDEKCFVQMPIAKSAQDANTRKSSNFEVNMSEQEIH